jgi:flagellar hook-associated protein 1 FlgK
MGLASVLNIGKQSLALDQAALQTIGHNIANAGVEGYSRQEVVPTNNTPQEGSFGFLGTGVHIDTVRQLVDRFLNIQIARLKAEAGALDVQAEGVKLAETFLNQSGSESGINGAINNFFLAAEELATTPEGAAERNALINAATVLARDFNKLSKAIEDLQVAANKDITRAITEVNQYAARIAELNQRIVIAETGGNTANDLRDVRQRILENLSELVDVNFIEEPDGAYLVFVGQSSPLVSKGIAGTIEGIENPDNVVGTSPPVALQKISYATSSGLKTDITSRLTSGRIGGLLKLRDTTYANLLDDVDNMAATLVNQINIIHTQGFGLDGSTNVDFFQPLKVNVNPLNSNSKNAVTGNANIQVVSTNSLIFDPTKLTIADYKIEFTSSTTFTVTDADTGVRLNATQVSIDGAAFGTDSSITSFTYAGGSVTAEFEGIRVAIQNRGGRISKRSGGQRQCTGVCQPSRAECRGAGLDDTE